MFPTVRSPLDRFPHQAKLPPFDKGLPCTFSRTTSFVRIPRGLDSIPSRIDSVFFVSRMEGADSLGRSPGLLLRLFFSKIRLGLCHHPDVRYRLPTEVLRRGSCLCWGVARILVLRCSVLFCLTQGSFPSFDWRLLRVCQPPPPECFFFFSL